MADNKVKFLRGTSAEYEASTKDNDVFYYITDTQKLYLGANEVTGEGITVDDILSSTSENPVQNKVVKAEFDKKAEKSIYGDDSISLGRKADTTIGDYSIAIGDGLEASAAYSHAEGLNNTVSGRFSTVKGRESTVSDEHSYADGNGNTVSGYYSYAIGNAINISGNKNFAFGNDITIEKGGSFAFGDNIEINKSYSAAFGTLNKSNSDTLFSIGDGYADLDSEGYIVNHRHNAFEITEEGGKLHDKDIATADDIPTSLPANGGNADTANKLTSSSYTTLTIDTTDWTDNSSGGYTCTKTLSSAMAYEHFNFEVVLSSEQSAAKLQIASWNYIMADGMITQTTSNGSTTAFTFYAFTTKPTVALTVAIQGVSGE